MKEEEYMRVGTTLYRLVNQPCANGGYEKKRVVWNNSTLRQDYGKNYLATVPKYDGFCTVPNHLNYQKEIEGFLNLYEPIEHKPQQGNFFYDLRCSYFGYNNMMELDHDLLDYKLHTEAARLFFFPRNYTGKILLNFFLKALLKNNVIFKDKWWIFRSIVSSRSCRNSRPSWWTRSYSTAGKIASD